MSYLQTIGYFIFSNHPSLTIQERRKLPEPCHACLAILFPFDLIQECLLCRMSSWRLDQTMPMHLILQSVAEWLILLLRPENGKFLNELV